jgi:CPA2 family monovalent cation:H+ antiporter-2
VAESQFAVDLAIVVSGGLLGAMVAHALRLPAVAGYLAAGLLLGPGVLGLVRDSEIIASMADLGVALLMFAVGVELSLSVLTRAKGATLVAAPLQLIVTMALGYGLGCAIGWTDAASIVLGFALALSSTTVVVKLLSDRGELHTRHGQAMVAILLVQDLAAVLMVATFPLLPGVAAGGAADLAGVMARALGFVVAVFVLARWVAPQVMQAVALRYSREVFIVMSATLCFVGAAAASAMGFSLALGAFVAGLLISESHYRFQILSDVTPLRDLFGMVFFVSLGLLWEIGALLEHGSWALALLLAVFVGRPLIAALSALAARYHVRSAIVTGLGLAQIGEFSFLVVTLAWRGGVIGDAVHSMLIPVAGISLFASPFLMKIGGLLYDRLRATDIGERAIDRQEQRHQQPGADPEGHALVCGYGRVGRFLGEVLRDQGQAQTVIDYDHATIASLRQSGTAAAYGDASRRSVLLAAGADRARLAVIALPDVATAGAAVTELRGINPGLRIVARAHQRNELRDLFRAGADRVVYAEYEVGLEIVRHALLLSEVDGDEVNGLVETLRQGYYDRDAGRDTPLC